MRTTKRRAGALGGAVSGALGVLAVVVVVALVGGPGLGVPEAGASNGALAHAKSDLIVRADFPKGWSANGSVTTSNGGGQNSFPGADQLASCLGVPSSLISMNTPSANSPTFQNSQRDSAQENLSIFPSLKVAAEGYHVLSSPKVPGCLTALLQGPEKSQLQTDLGHGITVGSVTVTPAPPSVLGSHAGGFVISIPATTSQGTFQLAVTIIEVLRGKLGARLTLSAVNGQFPVALEKHLVSVAYKRA